MQRSDQMDQRKHAQNAPRKRRKVASACERCRDRKIRCDGQKPSCDACLRRSNPRDQNVCTYLNENNARSLVQQDYIQVLQDRVRHLEARVGDESSWGASPNHLQHRTEDIQQMPWPSVSLNNSGPYLPPYQPGPHGSNHPADYTNNNISDNNSVSSNTLAPQNPMPMNAILPPLAAITSVARDDFAQTAGRLRSERSQAPESTIIDYEITSVLKPNHEAILQTSQESPNAQESPVNGMGAVTTTSSHADDARDGFYGKSSAISFFHQVKNVLDRNVMSSPSPRGLLDGTKLIAQAGSGPKAFSDNSYLRLQNFCLPPRRLADVLLHHYWQRVHSLHPVIHKATFLQKYRQLWEPENETGSAQSTLRVGLGSSFCPDTVFHCALNAMFALGSNFSDLPTLQRLHLSETLSQRSLDLLPGNLLDNGSIALVQTLLIAAQYLQSTDLPNRCWNVVGLALRVAQGLGLYIDKVGSRMCTIEIEIRRRAWHGCLMLDVITGMTLGRPIIPSGVSHLRLPAAIDDEYLECEAPQPEGLISENEFFVQTLKLYNLMGDIVTKVYNPWQDAVGDGSKDQERLQNSPINMIIDLECALSDFEVNIPVQLRWDRSGMSADEPTFLERHRNILQTRFLHLKVLLHRPIFYQLHGNSRLSCQANSVRQFQDAPKLHRHSADSVLRPLAQRCAATCVESSKDLIALIDRMSHSNAGGAWWYNVFYLFTSAMVLILGELCLRPGDMNPDLGIEASWRQCLKILEEMSPEHIAAAKCAKTLVSMREQAMHSTLGTPDLTATRAHPGEDSAVRGSSDVQQPTARARNNSEAESNKDEGQARETQLQDIFWMNSNIPLPWDSQEQDWWNSLLNSS